MSVVALLPFAFLSGVLMFLAPCSLPLVPGYLAFLSGNSDVASWGDKAIRRAMVRQACFVSFGFGLVFIVLGVLFGLGGVALLPYREILSRVGGVLIMFFGVSLLGVFQLPSFSFVSKISSIKMFRTNTSMSAFLFGGILAFGWSPCVGPILGSILILAASHATVFSGGLLLAVFSLGFSIPFIIVAYGAGQVSNTLFRVKKVQHALMLIGGFSLIVMGYLMATNMMGVWNGFFYRLFDFFSYDALLRYL